MDLLFQWVTFTTKFNTICWMVIEQLDEKSSKGSDTFRNTEWGPDAAEAMCKQVKDFPLPRNNMTIGDLIELTPKEYISKVMLEEKLFETWYDGRIVLIGDGNVYIHDYIPVLLFSTQSKHDRLISVLLTLLFLLPCLYTSVHNSQS